MAVSAPQSARARLHRGDCLKWLSSLPDDCVDLVFGSPPYEDARTYGIDFAIRGDAWVTWMADRMQQMTRVCKGLVAMVVAGKTRNYRWSATPALLMAELHRRGVLLRNPPIFHRVGIPGSGGPDWLRSDYEWIVCATKHRGQFEWSENTAMGHPPKWAPGGEMSNRQTNGSRVNGRDQWGSTGHATGMAGRYANGKHKPRTRAFSEKVANGAIVHTKNDGDGMREQAYMPPAVANPGNVVKCIVGGNLMGSKLAHQNEAPFPESLAEFFVRSWCRPGGIVLDPFCGSGTTLKVALAHGRRAMGCDVRRSQIDLTLQRLKEVSP